MRMLATTLAVCCVQTAAGATMGGSVAAALRALLQLPLQPPSAVNTTSRGDVAVKVANRIARRSQQQQQQQQRVTGTASSNCENDNDGDNSTETQAGRASPTASPLLTVLQYVARVLNEFENNYHSSSNSAAMQLHATLFGACTLTIEMVSGLVTLAHQIAASDVSQQQQKIGNILQGSGSDDDDDGVFDVLLHSAAHLRSVLDGVVPAVSPSQRSSQVVQIAPYADDLDPPTHRTNSRRRDNRSHSTVSSSERDNAAVSDATGGALPATRSSPVMDNELQMWSFRSCLGGAQTFTVTNTTRSSGNDANIGNTGVLHHVYRTGLSDSSAVTRAMQIAARKRQLAHM